MELTTCPQCGRPAEVEWRDVLESTDGPVEHARVRCVDGHWFFLPVAALECARPSGVNMRPVPELRHPGGHSRDAR